MGTQPAVRGRRNFLTKLKAATAGLAALGLASGAKAATQAPDAWKPAVHKEDAWFNVPSKHRLVFDTTTANGLGEALLFAANYIGINNGEYGVENSELAVVLVVRYQSVVFAYNDAIWAKYGSILGTRAKFDDPKTKTAPKVNVYTSRELAGLSLSNGANWVDLSAQGARLAVCNVATHNTAFAIGQKTGAKPDDVYEELKSNLVSNARLVPAGIVAVSRAQEYGYTLVTT